MATSLLPALLGRRQHSLWTWRHKVVVRLLRGRHQPNTHLHTVHHSIRKRYQTSHLLTSHLLARYPLCVHRCSNMTRQLSRWFIFHERATLPELNVLHACHPCGCSGRKLWFELRQSKDTLFKLAQRLRTSR